jgi:glutamine synthetase
MTRVIYDGHPALGVPSDEPLPVLPACTLVRLIGKAALDWTLDDLMELVPAAGIRLVSLMHVGGDGWPKTLDFVPRDVKHLREVLVAGERADGSSLFGELGISVGSSDIVLRPRLSTAFLDPFADQPTLVLLAAPYGRDGAPLAVSPTTLVQRAYERLKRETGVDLHALGEVEFFLGRRPEETDVAAAGDRGYHSSSPFVFGERMRREALCMLAGIGVPVKYGHAEVGHIQPDEVDARVWEQHEIELALQPLPAAADSVILTQWVLRNLAKRHGMRCTFEPILRKGHAGSGMHFHLSPVVDGIHATTREGVLTDEAKWLIGGLVRLAGASMAFGNRSLNSFLRLSQAKEAPNNVTWGQFNRKALIRLPIVATDERGRPVVPETIEFRLPDGSAHPHLVLAVVAQAMLAGRDTPDLARLVEKTKAGEGEAVGNGFTVPKGFADVAAALASERAALEAGDVFPSSVIDRMIGTLNTRKE